MAKVTPKKRKPAKKRSAGEWRPLFLATLAQTANVRASCQKAGISREQAYNHRDKDKEFAKQWEDAMEDAIEVLEESARLRALGISDTLMIFLLKAHRPEKYRERHEHKHSGGTTQTIIYLPQKGTA